MDYFNLGLTLAGQGVHNDPPVDLTRAGNESEPGRVVAGRRLTVDEWERARFDWEMGGV